ncbi:hypothetical protein [Bradyrhizobium sp. CCBAU 51753]|uniref:hypothetical protein n=1 Tax=Bradyrhizobium sp. CCBAU 51753 TaxID=1325100 RepID=UPI001889C458|nr:hypothetical protein [Bradyrhizobium sp. CCBAU 51753]
MAAKRRREKRQDAVEAGQLVQLDTICRSLEQTLLGVRDRLLNPAGETSYLLAMRRREECFEVVNDAIRSSRRNL